MAKKALSSVLQKMEETSARRLQDDGNFPVASLLTKSVEERPGRSSTRGPSERPQHQTAPTKTDGTSIDSQMPAFMSHQRDGRNSQSQGPPSRSLPLAVVKLPASEETADQAGLPITSKFDFPSELPLPHRPTMRRLRQLKRCIEGSKVTRSNKGKATVVPRTLPDASLVKGEWPSQMPEKGNQDEVTPKEIPQQPRESVGNKPEDTSANPLQVVNSTQSDVPLPPVSDPVGEQVVTGRRNSEAAAPSLSLRMPNENSVAPPSIPPHHSTFSPALVRNTGMTGPPKPSATPTLSSESLTILASNRERRGAVLPSREQLQELYKTLTARDPEPLRTTATMGASRRKVFMQQGLPRSMSPSPTGMSHAHTSSLGGRTKGMDNQRAGASDHDGRVFTRVKRVALVTCCVLVLAVVFATTFIAFQGRSSRGLRAKLCLSSDCRRHAVYLDNYINGSISPCEDFYGHVCSKWKEPEIYAEFKMTALSETAVNWVNRLPMLLERGAAMLEVGRKPLEMFQSCAKERSSVTARDVSVFLDFLGELNLAWPGKSSKNVSALAVLINLAVNWQMTFWWRFRFLTDPLRRHKLCIVAGDSDVLSLFIINHQKVLERRSYFDYWMSHYTTLYANSTPVPSTAEINVSAVQQTHILKVLADVQKKVLNPPAIVRHGNIGDHIGRVTSSLWLEELRRYMPSEYLLTADDHFLTDSLTLKAIGILFNTYNDEQLIYHMSWQFIQWYFFVLEGTPLEIVHWGKKTAEPYGLLHCAMYVEDVFRPFLAAIHVMSRLTRGDTSLLNLALSNLMSKVESTLNASRMQPESKRSILRKYQDIQVRLWPPSSYFNNEETAVAYSCLPAIADTFVQYWVQAHHCLRSAVGSTFHRETTDMQRLLSSSPVSYDSITNELVIAASALAPPLYYPRGTAAMFYGGLGFLVVANALEALDPTSLAVVSNRRAAAAGRGVRCTVFRANETRATYFAALGVTHSAFFEEARNESENKHRPISRNQSQEHVFFLTLGRLMCRAQGSEPSPVIDGNRLFKNSPEFSKSFNCPPGSGMNPLQRCYYFHEHYADSL